MTNKLNKAFANYKLLTESTNRRFTHLSDWLLFKSNIFINENIRRSCSFQKYKRGSIVLVRFGENIGYELSGNHFGIVMTKDDNTKNGLLTVIPLSSKDKKRYICLEELIIDTITPLVAKSVEDIVEDVSKCDSNTSEEQLRMLSTNLDVLKRTIEKYVKYDKKTFAMISNITSVSKFKVIKPISKFDPIGKMKVSDHILDLLDEAFIKEYTNKI